MHFVLYYSKVVLLVQAILYFNEYSSLRQEAVNGNTSLHNAKHLLNLHYSINRLIMLFIY